MKMKREEGYTGIDIAISVMVLFIFVSLLAILSYNINSSSKEIELKSKATSLAVIEIENIKNGGFEAIKNIGTTDANSKYVTEEEISGDEGFFRTIIIEDYAKINPEKIPNIVKKITVRINYMFKGKEQTVELSTILSKEN